MFQLDFTISLLILISVTSGYVLFARWWRKPQATGRPLPNTKIDVSDRAAAHERFERFRNEAYGQMPCREVTCLLSSHVSAWQVVLRREYEHAHGFWLVETAIVNAACVIHRIAFRPPGFSVRSERHAEIAFERSRVSVDVILSEAERLRDRHGEIVLLRADGEWSSTLLPPSGRRTHA